MMTKDPWAVLAKPRKDGDVVVRRVDENSPWNFFWGVDQNGAYLLMLRLSTKPTFLNRLPHLKGMDVLLSDPAMGPCLVIRLLDIDLKDIFYQLCIDMLDTAGNAGSELEVLELTVNRTISAAGWGIAHSLAAPAWGLVIWWPFLIFSTLFVVWRERGFFAGVGVAAAAHALQNLGPALLLATS